MVAEHSSEERRFTRVSVPLIADVTIGGALLHLVVRNLSMDGLCLETASSLPRGVKCRVALRHPDPGSAPWMVAEAVVVRTSEHDAGIHLITLTGLQSLDHLRTIILYHAEDPDRAVAEFDAHWGLKPKD